MAFHCHFTVHCQLSSITDTNEKTLITKPCYPRGIFSCLVLLDFFVTQKSVRLLPQPTRPTAIAVLKNMMTAKIFIFIYFYHLNHNFNLNASTPFK